MTHFVSRIKQPHELLNHILDQPELPALVQSLEAGVLTRLIRHVGLEDSGEIVALATVDQLRQVFDEDLWTSETAGREAVFNAERFGVWLEILLQSGADFAARKVGAMDEDLVTLGLSRLVLVVGLDDMALRLGADHRSAADDMLDKVLESTLNLELDGYLVMARSQGRWDAVCALLAELNQSDYALLGRLLERCSRITGEVIEDNGTLFDVLGADDMLEADMAAEREDRREQRGYVTATAAADFLRKARHTPLKKILSTKALDPVVTAYLKRTGTENAEPAAPDPEAPLSAPVAGRPDVNTVRFLQMLQEAEVLPAADLKRLDHGADPWAHPLPLVRALHGVQAADPIIYSQRLVELTYLSNVLMTGCAFQGREFRAVEAAEAASATCNLGAEYLVRTARKAQGEGGGRTLADLLTQGPLIRLFQAGWKILYEDVVRATAETLLGFVDTVKSAAPKTAAALELGRWGAGLRAALDQGAPWECDDPLDVLLLHLDGETAQAVAALLQPYPSMAEAVRRTAPESWPAFIGTLAQVKWVRQYLITSI